MFKLQKKWDIYITNKILLNDLQRILLQTGSIFKF